MKSARGSIGRSVDQPDRKLRFYLFHGPDEGRSSALAERLLKSLGAGKQVLGGPAVRSDPALLVDEAGAISLFGEPRVVWIQPAGDEIADAVQGLLDSPAFENPVVAIAGPLRKTSALLKLAEGHALALAHASYLPEGADAERVVAELARAEGLRPLPGVAGRLADACGNDQRMIAQELAKLALFLDASPEQPRELGHEALDAVGAEMGGDFLALADLALAGKLQPLIEELAQLSSSGTEAIPVIRSLQRRLMMLAPIRARLERGERPAAVMTSLDKPLFRKDKAIVEQLLGQWDAARLARVAERVGALERHLMRPDSPPPAEALGEELIAIARTARRR